MKPSLVYYFVYIGLKPNEVCTITMALLNPNHCRRKVARGTGNVKEARLRRFKEFDENSEYEWKKSISDNRGGNTQLRKSTELNEGKSIPLEQVQDKRHHIKHRSRRTLREHGEVKELDYGNQEALVKEQKSNHKDKNQAHSKQRLRRTLELVKMKEINDGEQKPLDKRPSQTHQRLRRTLDLIKAKEINDGEQKPLDKRPSQTHQRLRRTLDLVKTKEINDGEQKPLDKRPLQTHQRLRRTLELVKTKEVNDGEQKPLDKRPSQTHQRLRRTLEQLPKARELNDGEQKPLDKRPTQSEQRSRRTVELVKAAEINDGEEMPLEKKPSQTHQHRVKRWPQPGKQVHHGRAHKKLRVRDKKKSATVVKHHRAMRVRRAEMAEEQKQEEEKKHQKMDSSSSQSEESHEKKERPVRSLVTRELIPKGYPPNEPQSEETIERDKTLKSLYPFDLF
ncbi:hypothetical protein COOONC_00846 [Cooperia oncophora]